MRLNVPEICPPEVHRALLDYFLNFPVGAHTTTRLGDGRISIMGVTPRCIISPDEIWREVRKALIEKADMDAAENFGAAFPERMKGGGQ